MKTNRRDVLKRIAEVQELHLSGATFQEVCQFMSEKYGLGSRSAYRYIKHINKRIEIENQETRELLTAKNISRLTSLFKATKDTNPQVAVNAIKELNSMLGINLQRTDMTSKGEKIDNKITVEVVNASKDN